MSASYHDSERPPRDPTAEVVAVGRVHEVACSVVAANLQTALGLSALVLPPTPLPDHALLPARSQYDAAVVLDDLSRGLAEGRLRVGVTALDLCLPVLTYVYGEARVGGRAAVASTSRLEVTEEGLRAPRELVYERLVKVALHEAAHAMGLTHCREPDCLMMFSAGLGSLDGLRPSFCPRCARLVIAGREGLLD